MKKIIILLFAASFFINTHAQKINGQWRGYFNSYGDISLFSDASGTEYVLELEINGSNVTGSSYTYFQGRRYYVICSLNGTYDKQTKKIVVNEVERIKGSTPPDWSDCLQTHVLYYEKQEGKELLAGNWKTSPYQGKENGGCGTGNTTLSRRVMQNVSVNFNKATRTPPVAKKQPAKIPDLKDKNKTTPPPVVKTKPVVKQPTPPVAKNDNPVKQEQKNNSQPVIKKDTEKIQPQDNSFAKRNSNVIKTIEINKETFQVDLYDNGDIDGDTISLFFNGKLLLSHKRLSDKALSLTLDIDESKEVNELVMYAENLGEIPPNTALMVVTDGPNRYEVRIASDLQKSGAIRFIHKAKN